MKCARPGCNIEFFRGCFGEQVSGWRSKYCTLACFMAADDIEREYYEKAARVAELSFDVCVPREDGLGCGCPEDFVVAREEFLGIVKRMQKNG